MGSSNFDLIIVGGGIAGSAAALRAAQYERVRTVWVRGDRHTRLRSRSQWVVNIDNMIGIHDGVVRGKLLRELRGAEFESAREQLRQEHAHISTRDIVRNTVERLQESYLEQVLMIDEAAVAATTGPAGFGVSTASGELHGRSLVLATGVMDRQPFVRQQQGDEVIDDPRWIYPFANRETVIYCIRCEGHLTRGVPTALIGHGEPAAQIAMMLYERYRSACTVLTNGEEPIWSERSQRLLDAYEIRVRKQRIVDVGGVKGDLNGFRLDDGTEVGVQMALVALGLHRVYNELAIELGVELGDPELPEAERHVLIDWKGETNLRGVFALGDMVKRRDGEPVMKQVYTAQEYAVRAVDAIERRMRSLMRKEVLGEAS